MTATLDEQIALKKTSCVPIGPLLIDRVARGQVSEVLSQFLEDGNAHYIITVNLQFLGVASRSANFVEIVNQADLVVADGMPLVWLSRFARVSIPERITGHDLLHIAASLSAQQGYSIAFLGAGPGVAEEAARRLREMYPGLGFIKTYQGSFSQEGYGVSKEDEQDLVDSLRLSRPHFLFVALGCPKQEFWIARHFEQLGIPVCVGVGGTFDVLAGRLNRAPIWMQRAGLEWLFRLWQEPQRLWRRYILTDIPTLLKLSASGLSARVQPWPAGGMKERQARNKVGK